MSYMATEKERDGIHKLLMQYECACHGRGDTPVARNLAHPELGSGDTPVADNLSAPAAAKIRSFLQHSYGIADIRIVQPFYYAFTQEGRHTEILPDGTLLQSFQQWDEERRRRAPVGFRYFPQWRRDWRRPEHLPDGTPPDKPLFLTPEAEVNYHLYYAFDRRFMSEPLHDNACLRVAHALAGNGFPECAAFPAYREGRHSRRPQPCPPRTWEGRHSCRPQPFTLPHGVTQWKRGLIAHPRGRVMLCFATPTMLYGFDAFADGAVAACQQHQRGTLIDALRHLLAFLPTQHPSSEWWIVALRAIAAYALCLQHYKPRPVQLALPF